MKLAMLTALVAVPSLFAPFGAREAPPAHPHSLPQPLRPKSRPADPTTRSMPSCDPGMIIGSVGLNSLAACDPHMVIGRGMHPERMDRMNVLLPTAPAPGLPKR